MAESRVETRTLTDWFPKTIYPVRVGCYQTTSLDLTRGNGTAVVTAYSWWDGIKWTCFETWGDFHTVSNMHWRGIAKEPK